MAVEAISDVIVLLAGQFYLEWNDEIVEGSLLKLDIELYSNLVSDVDNIEIISFFNYLGLVVFVNRDWLLV
jgi:hypothetical protein